MIAKDFFIQELECSNYTNKELVDRYIWFGTPAIFQDNEQTYFDLRKEIADFFLINNMDNIVVVGSAKLGFSIAPRKEFRDITDDSDIDVAIIDDELFNTYWEKLYDFNINIKNRTETEDQLYRKFLDYFFRGWLRPDLFPFSFSYRNKWFDFFKSISYKKYDHRKIAAGIYKNKFFFTKYHERNIEKLREELRYGQLQQNRHGNK